MKCWTIAGDVHVAVKESTHMSEGFRVVDLSNGEMGDSLYGDMEELIEGEGLDPDLFLNLVLSPVVTTGKTVTFTFQIPDEMDAKTARETLEEALQWADEDWSNCIEANSGYKQDQQPYRDKRDRLRSMLPVSVKEDE